MNSSLAIMAEPGLSPLRSPQDQDVDNFPMAQGNIGCLSCEAFYPLTESAIRYLRVTSLNALLDGDGLPTVEGGGRSASPPAEKVHWYHCK